MKEPDYKLIISRQKGAISDMIRKIDKKSNFIKAKSDGTYDSSEIAKSLKARFKSFKSASSMIKNVYDMDSKHGKIAPEWYKRNLAELILAGNNLIETSSEIFEIDKMCNSDLLTDLKASSSNLVMELEGVLGDLQEILSDNDSSSEFVIQRKSKDRAGFAEQMAEE